MEISKEIHAKARRIITERGRLRDVLRAEICPRCGSRLKEVDTYEKVSNTGVTQTNLVEVMNCINCKYRITRKEYERITKN